MDPTQRTTPKSYEEWKTRLDELKTEVSTSEGYRYWTRISEFGKSFEIWNDEHVELADLLQSYEHDPQAVLRLHNVDRPEERDRLVRVLDRKTLSCMAAFKALEDHIKTTLHDVSTAETRDEYDRRLADLKREDVTVAFMLRFRNYLQHHKTAPWGTALHFRPGVLEGEIWLNATRLLAWDGFQSGARRFLRDHEPTFRFRPVLIEFGERWSELALWYCEMVRQEGASAMADAEELRLTAVRYHDSYDPRPDGHSAPGPGS